MKVTALLPTRGRETLALRALTCVLLQKWADLEIIVLDDARTPSFSEGLEVETVCYLRIDEESLGNKLNFGCSLATGKYIIHFHDDDACERDRIADQVERLEASGKAVTNYRNLRFTDGKNAWINSNWPGGFGTSLCHRRDWWAKHPFQAVESEDWEFVAEAMRANEFMAGDAGDLMLCTLTHNSQIGPGWIEL